MKKRIKRFVRDVWSLIRLPEMTMLPGSLAFFFVLSVVPTITIIAYGAAFFNLSMDYISNFMTEAFSPAISNMIFPDVAEISFGFKFFLSLAAGFFIASNGADSIILTSNTIYGIKNGSYLKRRIKALVMTIFIVLLFLFILLVPVFGNKIIELIYSVNLNTNVTRNIHLIIFILKSPISWFIMFMFIKILYTMAPDRKLASANVNYGSIFTTICWTSITALYSYYITHFSNYSAIYGGLANIVILMLWVYLLAIAFVIGMALNFKNENLAKTGHIEITK